MTERARNLAVGVTVLVALAMLGGLVLLFTGLPEWFQSGYRIDVQLPSTAGTNAGDLVHFSGMNVGRVTDIEFTNPNRPSEGVTLSMRIAGDVRIPANSRVYVIRGFMGSPYIEINADGPPMIDPNTGKEIAYLSTDTPATLEGRITSSGPIEEFRPVLESFDAIADDLQPTIRSFGQLASNLNALIAPRPAGTGPDPNAPADPNAPRPPAIRETMDNLNETLQALHDVLGDPNTRANLKTSLANLAEATGKASAAMDDLSAFARQATTSAEGVTDLTASAGQRIDEVARGLVSASDKLSDLLATLNRVAVKLEKGQGSAGRFVNDPKLYNQLVTASTQLSAVATDLRKLLAKWEAEGLPLKLNP
jgi:phospholipid/cholesterol/gamma-HCH transport system substrate-binding protein